MKLIEEMGNLEIQSIDYFFKAKKFIEQLPNWFKGSPDEWGKFLDDINGKYFYVGVHFISYDKIAVELLTDEFDKEEHRYIEAATKFIKWVKVA